MTEAKNPPFEAEDDPGELVELIAESLVIPSTNGEQAKRQLYDALVKLIDSRIQAAKR